MKRYELPKLDYAYDALEPVVSARIMQLHHSKHHAGYVNNANLAIEKLEKHANGDNSIDVASVVKSLSFNLNGHLMHEIFWKNMRPVKENNAPSGKMLDAINKNFGTFEAFKKQFEIVANSVEGSGWAVLASDDEQNLFVIQVEKHNLMHLAGFKPILVLDVWEHAFYLQYENKKADFVSNFWKIVNWDDVNSRLQSK
jgi:Fe-Mn family superoxide dismutase